MKKKVLMIAVFIFCSTSLIFAQAIPIGSYTSMYANGIFSIVPPPGFSDIKDEVNGVTFFNHDKKLSFSILYTNYSNLAEKKNDKILERFTGNEFMQGFIRGFNSVSERNIIQNEIIQIGQRKVLKITALDPHNKINPVRAVIFYHKGKEIKITVGGQSLSSLDENDSLFAEVIAAVIFN